MLTLQPVRDWSDLQQNFDAVARLFKKPVKAINYGTDTATFTASSTAVKTVAHGLGVTPSVVLVVPYFNAGITAVEGAVRKDVSPPDATGFTAMLITNPSTTTVSASYDFFWLAAGG